MILLIVPVDYQSAVRRLARVKLGAKIIKAIVSLVILAVVLKYAQLAEAQRSIIQTRDVVVVKQPDGSYKGTTLHLRFGEFLPSSSTSEQRILAKINNKLVNIKFDIQGDGINDFDVVLTTDEIKAMNLNSGPNGAVFTLESPGILIDCVLEIYLWSHKDKLVITDIDGTITRSPIMGQLYYFIGIDHTHDGIAQLYKKIIQNGYKLVYLSARALSQASQTQTYLRGIEQDGVRLPEGPILLSPDGLLASLHREIIISKPEEFKIDCLREIRDLFPDDNPFFAGFGDRSNDMVAYREVGVPLERIYRVNSYGVLKVETDYSYQSSYTCIARVAEELFPKRTDQRQDHIDDPVSVFKRSCPEQNRQSD